MAGSKKHSQDDADFRRRLRELHRRLVRKDAAAFEEIVSLLEARLVAGLSRHFGRAVDEQIIEESVEEALLRYRDKPTNFDPKQRVPLDAFLELAANRRVLNALRGERRRKVREAKAVKEKSKSDNEEFFVELELPAVYIGRGEEQSTGRLFLDSVESSLPNPKDRLVFRLRRQGETDVRRYAQALGVAGLAADEQRHELKKSWDRIIRFAKRKAKAEVFRW
jgi:RNA polymerase sigma factor (sigma-70 family)